ncbi:AAA family ATPase [Pararhodobacter oceanensis]|uniref:ATPase n=1 Tax=Pararhodobacter oceanensis TaxID=2172121 RepID=A0A2T8HU84_9RHOB|nr:AAA family ATPase [Pararhodobacter oceanensis]PVH28953.1 ATPase [Pararhodobacter oceanensis]
MTGTRLTIISGCSGGGKSTLLLALAARGYATVEEPGRRIVAEELAGEGRALPWVNPQGFARRAFDLALADLTAVEDANEWVFFDRGLGDAMAALQHCGAEVPDGAEALAIFDPLVFMAPPWPEIYQQDAARRHGFAAAVAEYERLCTFYPAQGFTVITLPKAPVAERVEAILAQNAAD